MYSCADSTLTPCRHHRASSLPHNPTHHNRALCVLYCGLVPVVLYCGLVPVDPCPVLWRPSPTQPPPARKATTQSTCRMRAHHAQSSLGSCSIEHMISERIALLLLSSIPTLTQYRKATRQPRTHAHNLALCHARTRAGTHTHTHTHTQNSAKHPISATSLTPSVLPSGRSSS